MYKLVILLLFALVSVCNANEEEKPAVIITQDGEVDDRSSFTRFLLYTPDIDLRGIIATNSKWQKNGHGLDWIYEAYYLYGQVRENLLLHNPDYPTVEFLKSITVLGNQDTEHLTGEAPYVDSEGSKLIVKELLKIEDNLLHMNCWGGVNTVAQALWKFRKNYPDEYKTNISKVRVITIDFQDEAGNWIVNNMPEVRIIRNNAFHMSWNYHNKEPLKHNPYPQLMSEKWLSENVKQNHGLLGAWYPQKNISEGDTPAFLNFVDNGLEAYKDYSSGGWGGRYRSEKGNYWRDAFDDNNERKTLWRWIPDVQNDFEARMDWCVKSYEEANHPPEIEEVTVPDQVEPGQKVELKASAIDPDGDQVYYWWWHYPDPAGMDQHIKIVHETSDNAHFVVPENTDKDIHIILEVSDDGSPFLKRYKRLIFRCENENATNVSVVAGDPATLEKGLISRDDIIFFGGFEQGYNNDSWKNRWGIPWMNRATDNEVVANGFQGGKSLRVKYPEGGVGPGETGGQFPMVFRNMEGLQEGLYQELYLRYYLKFEEGFDFNRGGKLPGLMGGGDSWGRSGGNQPDGTNGWTLRFMWQSKGKLVIYAYIPKSENGKWGNDRWGQNIDCDFKAEPGKWHCIEQYVDTGTPGKDDGKLKVWIDGVERLNIDDMRFRNVENDFGPVGGIFFSTFHGGNSADWAPRNDSFAQFDGFAIAKNRVGLYTD